MLEWFLHLCTGLNCIMYIQLQTVTQVSERISQCPDTVTCESCAERCRSLCMLCGSSTWMNGIWAPMSSRWIQPPGKNTTTIQISDPWNRESSVWHLKHHLPSWSWSIASAFLSVSCISQKFVDGFGQGVCLATTGYILAVVPKTGSLATHVRFVLPRTESKLLKISQKYWHRFVWLIT